MDNKITFDTLPSAVMELTKKVDLLISMFSTKIEKREEIPKYMNTETALEYTALSFKTTSIILVILRKTIIFAHSDAGSTASGVSFYRSYKIIFVGGNQMRQRSFFDFRLNFRYAKIRFILLICNILHV